MKQRTEEEWRRLHENAICAIITGSMANVSLCQSGVYIIIDDGINGADYLVRKLKKREAEEAMTEQ
jgi:hypothetical protein